MPEIATPALPQTRVHYETIGAAEAIAEALGNLLPPDRDAVFLCIGTDRSTGDAFGPMVGELLTEMGVPRVFGTLAEPVHASNLADALGKIRVLHPGSFAVAVDACLGNLVSIGQLSVKPEPMKPGAGVNKALPEVGDVALTGTVNVGGFMEYFVLQNTRLHLVMRMADVMADGISRAVMRRGRVREVAAGRDVMAGDA